MLLLSDSELLEGFSGGIGLVLFHYLTTKNTSHSVMIGLFVAWSFVWYFRKIVDNIYIQSFQKKGHKLPSIHLPLDI